ncbi:hypothetical protein G7Y79_00029g064040 [Physcia stellaris]|nr:hypothetical protein G7Y79_00029g064040 [Physcia stellaris]
MAQLHPLLTLLVIFGLYHIYASAQPINNTISPSPLFRCNERRTFTTTLNSNPTNCAHAIIKAFPMDSTPGWFHKSRVSDGYRLPIYSTVEDCTVAVLLDNEHPVKGSWHELWTMANTLSTACLYYRGMTASSAATGGWVHKGGLTVQISKPPTNAVTKE